MNITAYEETDDQVMNNAKIAQTNLMIIWVSWIKHNVTISYFAQQQTQSPQKAVTTLLKKETTTYREFLTRENVMEKS